MRSLSACIVVLVLAGLAGAVDPARACSCVEPDPWTYLRQADGAFVGRLVSRRESGNHAVLTFSVERPLKGRLGDTVTVRTALYGAACGIEAEVGQRVGLFLRRVGNAWLGDLCHQVAPEDLLAAAGPLPAPNGTGAPAMYVGGRFGPARTLALDARGRTLAYGLGGGVTRLVSLCPGGRRLAEIADLHTGGHELAIRDGTTLRVLRRRALNLPGGRYPAALQCTSTWGSSVAVFGIGAGDSPAGAALYRLGRGRPTAIWSGSAYLSSLGPGAAYLNEGAQATRLVRVELRTGRVTRIARLPLSPRLVPDPTGRTLAGVAYRAAARSRLVLVQLGKAVAVRSIALDAPELLGDVHWLADGRLLFLPTTGRAPAARILDRSLRTHSRFPWLAAGSARVGSTVFGVGYQGHLVSARLPDGPQRTVRRLPGGGRGQVLVSAAG